MCLWNLRNFPLDRRRGLQKQWYKCLELEGEKTFQCADILLSCPLLENCGFFFPEIAGCHTDGYRLPSTGRDYSSASRNGTRAWKARCYSFKFVRVTSEHFVEF